MIKPTLRGADKPINESVAEVIAEMGLQNRPGVQGRASIAKQLYPVFLKLSEQVAHVLGQDGNRSGDLAMRVEQVINPAILALGKMVPEVGQALQGAEGKTFTSPLEALRQAGATPTPRPEQPQQPQQQKPDQAKPTEVKPEGQHVAQGVPGPASRNGG